MELKKHEGLAGFMSLEKDLILRAMEDLKGIDPALAARGVEATERRRQDLQLQISELEQEWRNTLDKVRQDSIQFLNEDEVQEYKHRLTTLQQELDFKTKELEKVN